MWRIRGLYAQPGVAARPTRPHRRHRLRALPPNMRTLHYPTPLLGLCGPATRPPSTGVARPWGPSRSTSAPASASGPSPSRLRLIEIYDVKRLQLRWATSLIGGPSTLPTFAVVYALFRPTFPRIYDKDRGIYTLFYPGLSFAFPIPSQYTNLFTNGEGADFPLEFPDGTTPVTCRVSIYDSSTDSKVGVDH